MNRRGAGPFAVFVVGPENAVSLMSNDTPDKPDEDEDWMKYANAGFGETDYSLWDDQPAEQEEEEEPDFDLNSTPNQLGTHMEEIPRAPSPAGHKHLVRIGTCDHCLGRLGGKKRYEQTIAESGVEIRASVVQRDSHLENARTEIPLCPFCENLYEEADLLADIIHDSIQPYEATRLQLGARIPKDQIAAEEELRKRLGAGGSDALKLDLSPKSPETSTTVWMERNWSMTSHKFWLSSTCSPSLWNSIFVHTTSIAGTKNWNGASPKPAGLAAPVRGEGVRSVKVRVCSTKRAFRTSLATHCLVCLRQRNMRSTAWVEKTSMSAVWAKGDHS